MALIERVTAGALRHRALVAVGIVALTATGLLAWRDLPVEAFPDLTNNQVVVVTQSEGLAAPDVEQRITYPIETALMGTPGAEEVRSISKFGLSMVTVVFDDAVPIYLARQLVTERVSEVRGRIPPGAEPALGPVATAFGEIYQYLVEGTDTSLMARKTLHDWAMRHRLREVPGVSEVNSWGGLTEQFHVVVDPSRLEQHGLDVRQVVTALAGNNQSFTGGFVERQAERTTVRGLGLIGTHADIESVVITAVNGVPVLLRDVADVRTGAMPRQGAVTRDGRGETVAGMVIMLKGENGHTVGNRARTRIEEIRASLPADVRITPFYDQTTVIDRTSATVRRNLIEGSLLVVAVLFVFLRDVRASLIVAAVIPLSMLCGFIGMRLFGVSSNLMSLGAIDFGLIVDGAVVMMENFVRRRAEADAILPSDRQDEGRVRLALFTPAGIEVARPILFGVLIIIAVYLPVFTLEGLEGKMFRPMAITVCSAILGALVLSLTAVPAAAASFLRLSGAHDEERWFVRLRDRYTRHLADAMRHRRRTMAVALFVVIVAVGSLPFLGTEFMPRLDEGAILIETRKLPSVSLEESVAISTRIERIVAGFPEVSQVVTKLGRPDLATEAMGIYQGDVYVNLHDESSWTTGRDKAALVDAIAVAIAEMPGVTTNFTQPMAMRLDETVSGVKADVAVKIFGEDSRILERLAAAVEGVLANVPGVADLQVDVFSGASELQLEIDRAALARYGLQVDHVREVVAAAIGGTEATAVLDGPRRIPVVVRLPETVRASEAALAAVLVNAPGGEKVPLGRLTRFVRTSTPDAISHEGGQRRLVVQCNVRGRDIGSFVAEAQRRLASVDLPSGYYVRWGGQFENQSRAMSRLALVIPLSLAIIFGLLWVTFRTLRHAALIILNVPFALVGGIAALWIRGLNLNLSASVGFVALFGVAVLNGVVLITAVNQRRADGQLLRDAVLGGAGSRLKAVLMTALVAALGFVPMALSHGAGAEVQRPLASVVIGGVITSTLLTLIVLPVVYEMIENAIHAPARRRG
ncbi:MAG TPA: CusA/CzcA family heavy metal efflux RND transporter [Luteitalea sp.]|nr:CusA/CzcA family heavy metal efflux RND transporter [Luteitalea sp.]